MSKTLHIILAMGLFALCGYLLFVDRLELPSRTGADSLILIPPVTYLMALLPLAFSVSLILYVIDRVKYKKQCSVIVTIGVILFFIGMVIVAPLLKLIE